MTSAKEGNRFKVKKRSPYQVMVATPKTKGARSSSSQAKSSTSIKTSMDVLSKEEIRSLETFEKIRQEIHIRDELLAAPSVISEEKLWNALRRLLLNKSEYKVMKFLKFFRKVLSKESKAAEEIRSLETFEKIRQEIHIRDELLAAPSVISEEKLWNALRRLLSNKSEHEVMKFLKFFRIVLSKKSKAAAAAPNMASAPNMAIETIGGQFQNLNL